MHKKQLSKNARPSLSVQSPQFGEIQPSGPDPSSFKVLHSSDKALYAKVNNHLLQPIPAPRDPLNLVLTLEQVLGSQGSARIQAIEKAGQIVFHSGGDTGSVGGPHTESLVADKMANDYFNEQNNSTIPSFFFHLGDVVYSFGEGKYYYDQFYEPHRNYPGPILAIPGNHDGMVYKGDPAPSLDAFVRNFVSDTFVHTPEAGGLMRTAMIQPGVYFVFDAPFVSIIGLYSNVLEDPGIISSQGDKSCPVNDQQLDFLINQLSRLKNSNKAVLVAVHHPPFTWGTNHGGSPRMLKDLDDACNKAGFWPHAFLSGHAHSYQRFTRTQGKFDIPYIVTGNSGHGLTQLRTNNNAPMRTPIKISDSLLFENYDDKNYGYLRIICDNNNLSIEYHDANPDQKSYSDAVTVDLKSHTMISN